MTPICTRFHYKTPVYCFLARIYLLLCLLCLSPAAPLAAQAARPQTEHKLSRQETAELFRSLDDILRFASEDTKLPIRHSVKRELTSRDQVVKDLNQRLNEDEDAKRLQRSELVLKKFGFLPRNFDLRTYMVSLMREQVAGFYNAKDKTVYLLDWVRSEQQKPVMAHELTHALQDQNFELGKWLAGDDGKITDKSTESDKDTQEIVSDEQQIARQALVEGQGMAVLIDYYLRDSGQSVSTASDFVEALKQGISSGENTPVYAKAPMYMRECLGFPYRYGLGFVQALLQKGGKDLAFAGALKNPPQSSRQIMTPEAYLSNEKLQPLALPHMTAILGKDYERYDVGSVGQLEVMVLLKQFTPQTLAEKLTAEWRGGAYYAALKHSPPERKLQSSDNGKQQKNEEERPSTKSLAILYLSRWSSPEAALTFAKAYASMLWQRYNFADPVEPDPANQKDAAKNDAADPKSNAAAVRRLSTHWITDEGRVLIEAQGTTVLVLESFDPKTESELNAAVWQAAAQQAKVASK